MKRFVSMALAWLLAMATWAQTDSAAVTQDSLIVARDSLALPQDSVAPDTVGAYVPRVSLLTCSPAAEVWQQYGHTAIRYEDTEHDVDVVFNYGLFDFDTPHFIWRFCLGQTDYIVGAEMYDSFKKEYMERGSSITEQELALTPQETDRLWNLLALNCRPENRTYRYNFFYNNCSTKARDIIYQSLAEPVSVARMDSVSLRNVLHNYNTAYPWASFGIDLLLGIEADRPVPHNVQEFAPLSLEESLAKATRSGGELFVSSTTVIQPAILNVPQRGFSLTPVQLMIVVLLITAIICTLELLTGFRHWWYDIVLYGTQGVAGLIVAFLFLFSTHPAVNSNVLVVVLNPLVLVLLPFLIRQSRRRKKPWAAWTEVGLVVLLVVVWLFVRQGIPIAAWVFFGSLLLRSVHHIIRASQKNER